LGPRHQIPTEVLTAVTFCRLVWIIGRDRVRGDYRVAIRVREIGEAQPVVRVVWKEGDAEQPSLTATADKIADIVWVDDLGRPVEPIGNQIKPRSNAAEALANK
jgi:hypothetical protein